MTTTGTRTLFSREVLGLSAAVILTVALVAFEGLSVAAALPEIGSDLGAIKLLPWVMTGYLLASGLALALAGPLVDALGARLVFRWATIAFAAASVACGLSPAIGALIGMRVLQGAAGGMVMATSAAAIGLGYPDALRSRAYALAATVWGVMAFGGPALAAFLLTVLDWRWIFLVNAPLAVFAAVIGWSAIPGPVEGRAPLAFDRPGIVLVTAFTSVALVGVSGVSVASAVALAAAVALGALYWAHSGRAPSPLLRRRHFAEQPFRALALTAGLVMAAGIGIDTYLPLYVRGVRGASAAAAAWSVVFLTVGWTVAANVVSRLYHRVSEGRIAVIGSLLMVPVLAAGGAMVLAGAPLPWLFTAFFLVGFAIGAVTNACITLVQRDACDREIGRATAAHQFSRNMAVTYGTAAAGAILLLVAASRSGDVEAIRTVLAGEPTVVAGAVRFGLAQGFAGAHGVGLVLALGAFAASLPLWRPRR